MCRGPRHTSKAEHVRKRFRDLALLVHPDLNPDDPRAGERFQRLVAWRDNMLGRAECDDSCEDAGPAAQRLAGTRKRRPARTPDGRTRPNIITIDLPFDDAARGTELRFPVRGGDQVIVRVPAGVENNHVISKRVRLVDGRTCELAFEIRVAKHRRYWRQGADLLVRVLWSDAQMMRGATVRVPTPFGDVSVPVPRFSKRGDIIPVAGKGLPSMRGRGRLLVELSHTEVPPQTRPGLLD
ncbi:MAG TPA: DnaJ C-terminal domain-containing protein [Kofleriaceae bacterium]|nr:DnaJ C-terminal domain-containing protein [Kofleriaceae bacterium]